MTAERIAEKLQAVLDDEFVSVARAADIRELCGAIEAALLDVERLDTLDREGVVDFVRIIPAQPGGDIRKRIDKFAARAAIKKEQEG